MSQFFDALWSDESGQDLTEWVLLIVVIALSVTLAIIALREELLHAFGRSSSDVSGY